MSSWSEKTGAEKAKDILFTIMLCAVGYYGFQDITQRRERQALHLNNGNFANREVTYITDQETQQKVLEKTGKLFVLASENGFNRIYTFVPLDQYLSPEMEAYVQDRITAAKKEIANEAIQAAHQSIDQNYGARPVGVARNDDYSAYIDTDCAQPQAPRQMPARQMGKPVARLVNGQWQYTR